MSEPGSRIVSRDADPVGPLAGLAFVAARPSSAPLGGRSSPSAQVQRRIVLVGDQDLRDVALGLEPQLDLLGAQRLLEFGERMHVGL